MHSSLLCVVGRGGGHFVAIDTVHKMKFSIQDVFSKCDQIQRKLRIWSHLLKKSLVENLIFCVVRWVLNHLLKTYMTKICLQLISQFVRGKTFPTKFFKKKLCPSRIFPLPWVKSSRKWSRGIVFLIRMFYEVIPRKNIQ